MQEPINLEKTAPSLAALRTAYGQLKAERPKLRIFDAAQQLAVSEAQLLCTQLGENVIRLDMKPVQLLKELEAVGEVMALTRNEWAVIEKVGVYQKVRISPHVALVLDKNIDLRVFPKHWKAAFAVDVPSRGRILKSFQIFDSQGKAVHKIYLKGGGDAEAWQGIIDQYRAEDQASAFIPEPAPEAPEYKKLSDEELAQFKADWLALQDTHHFHGMIRKYGIHRLYALANAPEGHAIPLSKEAFVKAVEIAAEKQVSIMVFVGNPGCIEIHTGAVQKLVPMDNWFNIMDPKFNLHLRTDAIHTAWVVKKPTEDGVVTSIEIYDEAGENIALLFGERKPGIVELDAWREIVESVQ